MNPVLSIIGIISLLLGGFLMARARLLMWKHRKSNVLGVREGFSAALVKGDLNKYVEDSWVPSIKRHAHFGLALFTLAVWCLGIGLSGL
ncbi:hypothetical protein [Amphritea sp.]|uniref:hypothetical protein n=1 Tax=Amphritea sp. TaxID=1872502 RepID=UPI003D14A6EC